LIGSNDIGSKDIGARSGAQGCRCEAMIAYSYSLSRIIPMAPAQAGNGLQFGVPIHVSQRQSKSAVADFDINSAHRVSPAASPMAG
jgi:hypothetical protein